MPVTLPDAIYAIGRGLRGGVVDPIFAVGGSLYARLRDGAGNNITSTAVGAQRALDVNIAAGAGAGGTSMIDDTVFTPGATAVTPAAGTYRSVRDLVDDNDAGALAMTQRRALYTSIETVAGDSAMDEANDAVRVNIVAGAAAGGTSMIDDAAFTPGATAGTPMFAFADEAAPDSVDEGDAGIVRMSLNRNLYTVIRDAAGNERGLNVDAANTIGVNDGGGNISVDDGGGTLSVDDAGGSLTVDNTVLSVVGGGAEATAQRITIANDSTGVLSIDDNGASLTVDNPALSVVGGGAEATALRVTMANDSTGLLSVDDNGGSLTVDGAGTSMVDDAAFTPATTPVTPIAAFADEVAPDSVDEGDAGVVRMSLNRNLYTVIRDAAGNERGLNIAADNTIGVNDAGGSLTVDNAALSVVGGGAEATAQRVTIANDSTGLLSVDDAGGSLTVDNAALSVVGGGAEVTALRVTIANDSSGTLTVDNTVLSVVGGGAEATAQRVTIANDSTGVLTVDDGGGSLTIDGTVTASNTAGDVADDAVDSGNPVKIGALAKETDGTDPGSVSAEDDRTELISDRNRRLLVNTGHPNAFSNNNNYAAAQTDTQIQATPGANLSLYITDVVMSVDTAGNIQLVRNTAASTTVWGPFYFAANGGLIKHFATPIRLPANENLGVTSVNAGNHTISVQGYIAP